MSEMQNIMGNNLKPISLEQFFKTKISNKNFIPEGTISHEEIMDILSLAIRRGNCVNAQISRVVVVTDKEMLKDIAKGTYEGRQVETAAAYIMLYADLNAITKAAAIDMGKEAAEAALKSTLSHSEILVAMGIDAGILFQSISSIAVTRGYGSSGMIGTHMNPAYVIEKFNLPQNSFPIMDMTIGIIDEARPVTTKPRLDVNSLVTFNSDPIKPISDEVIAKINNDMQEYAKTNKFDPERWTDGAMFYLKMFANDNFINEIKKLGYIGSERK